MRSWILRRPEPEIMDQRGEVAAYRAADFTRVNLEFTRTILAAGGRSARAIDLGTGPAEIPCMLATLAPAWRIVAVDASAAMLREAHHKIRSWGVRRHVRLVLSDATALAAVQERFDVVFSNSLLHHLETPIPFWRECARLTTSGGTLLVRDLTRPRTLAAARRLVRRYAGREGPCLQELFFRSLLAAYRPEEIRAQLRASGVRGLRIRKVGDRHIEVTGTPRPAL